MKLVRFLSLLVLGFVYQSFYSQEVIIYSDMPIVDTDFENVQERKEYEFDPDINYTRSGGGYILESNGLYGLANYYKEIFIPTTYDNIYFQNNVFVLEKEGKIEVRRAFGDAKTFAGILLPSGIWDVISVNQHSALLREDSNEIIYFSFKEQKKILSSVEYALVEPDFMMLKINGKYGVQGETEIVPFEYDFIELVRDYPKTIQSKKHPKQTPLDSWDLVYKPYDASSFPSFALYKDKKVGAAYSKGIIYEADNDLLIMESQKIAAKKKSKFSLWQASNKGGKSDYIYDEVKFYSKSSIVQVKKGKKIAVLDYMGKFLVPFEYDADEIDPVTFIVIKNGKKGFYMYEEILPTIYDNITSQEGSKYIMRLEKDGKFGLFYMYNKVRYSLPVEYDVIEYALRSFIVAKTTDKQYWGVVDEKFKPLVEMKYKELEYSDHRYELFVLTKWEGGVDLYDSRNTRFYNFNDVVETDRLYSDFGIRHPFHSERYVKNKDGKYGVMNDKEFNIAIPMVYDSIVSYFVYHTDRFGDPKAFCVINDGKYGVVDYMNNIIIPIEYDWIDVSLLTGFESNRSWRKFGGLIFEKEGKYGIVDFNNEFLIQPIYTELERMGKLEFFKAKKQPSDRYEVLNILGEPLTDEKFDDIHLFRHINNQFVEYFGVVLVGEEYFFLDNTLEYNRNEPLNISPLEGYKTLDEFKTAFIQAMDSKKDADLKAFVKKALLAEYVTLREGVVTKDEGRIKNMPAVARENEESFYNQLLYFKKNYWNKKSRGEMVAWIHQYREYDKNKPPKLISISTNELGADFYKKVFENISIFDRFFVVNYTYILSYFD